MYADYAAHNYVGGWTLLGMWVYARRSGSSSSDGATDAKLIKKDDGPYSPETFRYCPVDETSGASARGTNPLVLIGHIAHSEYPDRFYDGMPVQVDIQGLHEVLMEIQVRGDQLNDPRGADM
ncbi:hypothetical protein F4820DRAFT_444000 [Hypoxylon rubiginosum]|uniref:Uncharacterized protein n=1 Tax=Hypoxylon rubiginosum TaxID=110542 RepID=A0ACB9ZDD0_9PEZI|nr:hypothetical protein F4820DRAFT_444000 [Hypoxylon rubiginosum]